MSFGRFLKILRIQNNLNQKELGKIINFSQSQISNLENDKSDISLTCFINILSVFKISLAEYERFCLKNHRG